MSTATNLRQQGFFAKYKLILYIVAFIALMGLGFIVGKGMKGDKYNGYEYVDLGLSVKWATCNVGASSPEEYGDYYAWGETTLSEENSTTGKEMHDIGGNKRYDAARANWGGKWRLPTEEEYQELLDNCTWEWATQNGNKGYKVTSEINGNSIFLPAAGYRDGTWLIGVGSNGDYWSSTLDESYTSLAYLLFFDSDGCRGVGWDFWGVGDGRSVRPVIE